MNGSTGKVGWDGWEDERNGVDKVVEVSQKKGDSVQRSTTETNHVWMIGRKGNRGIEEWGDGEMDKGA